MTRLKVCVKIISIVVFIWLEVSTTNSDPCVVLNYYLDALKKLEGQNTIHVYTSILRGCT